MGWTISDKKRATYRESSKESRERKRLSLEGKGDQPVHEINVPKYDPIKTLKKIPSNGFSALSLFSGGGGLDLGFERAGFNHIASYDILDIAGETLRSNRPGWSVFSGEDGDVKSVDWSQYKKKVTVLHGGPPCQPFSIAGKRKGDQDERDMWGSFVEVIRTINPDCFVAENVKGLLSEKFQNYVFQNIINPLKDKYHISCFQLMASDFGVPQKRQRVFFVGFRSQKHFKNYIKPVSTYNFTKTSETNGQVELFKPNYSKLKKCMGMRAALGLPEIGHDDLCPTLRSGFTGPRFSTSLLNSKASEKSWASLQIWPNGVASSRERARLFVAKNKHFRLSVQDVALLQGFPKSWAFRGAVYQTLGQIGNSVCPPMAYQVAASVSRALTVT